MTAPTLSDHPSDWVRQLIGSFVSSSKGNDLKYLKMEPAFDAPLVGFSSGADPLYDEYVAHIGDFYLKPVDIFQKAFPDQTGVTPEDLTVISWILPSTAKTREEQSARDKRPSPRWARTRDFGESFNEALRRHVVDALDRSGVSAVAPMLADFWEKKMEGPYAPCSNWSERHAAYAAGLGTFGLCDGLITPVGKAVRIGSVVARIRIQPSLRPYNDPHAYCLHFSQGTCGKCIDRCPVNALSPEGHDKSRCMQYTEHAMREFMVREYRIDTHACGLCQCDVPCMDHIPHPSEG